MVKNKLTKQAFLSLEENHTFKDGRKLLVEYDAGNIAKQIVEQQFVDKEIDDSNIFFECILQRADAENRNGRIYPYDVLQKQMEKYAVAIKEKRALGERDHPESQQISLINVSHMITDYRWEGKELIGKLKLFTSKAYHTNGNVDTPGDSIANMIRHGAIVGISSRGVGSLKKINGKNVVQDDFELVGFDIVASPSTYGAYLHPLREDFTNKDQTKGDLVKESTVFEKKLKNFLLK